MFLYSVFMIQKINWRGEHTDALYCSTFCCSQPGMVQHMSQDVWHIPLWFNASYTNRSVTRGVAWRTWDFPGANLQQAQMQTLLFDWEARSNSFLVGLEVTKKMSPILIGSTYTWWKEKAIVTTYSRYIIKEPFIPQLKPRGGKGPRRALVWPLGSSSTW